MQNDYWVNREKRQNELADKTYDEITHGLFVLYQKLLNDLKSEILKFYGKYSKEGLLTIADVNRLLTLDELRDLKYSMSEYYKLADKAVIGNKISKKYQHELKKLSARSHINRLQALEIVVKNKLVNLGGIEEKQFAEGLSKAYDENYKYTSYEIDKRLGFTEGLNEKVAIKAISEKWLDSNFSERIWTMKTRLSTDFKKELLKGLAEGIHPNSLASRLAKVTNVSYKNCIRLARTETIHILNQATLDSYREHNVEKYQFSASLNEKTCPVCGKLDGKVFERREAIEGVNYPVMHPNCVLGDSVVLSPDAEKLTRSEYSGNIFKFVTSKGRNISITPNHIMLTSRGWVRAKDIVKGDKIIYYLGWDKFVENPANNNIIPTIKNLFTSFFERFPMLTTNMKSSAKDFKGDVVENTKIDIVNINGFLRNKIDSTFKKFISDLLLVNTSEVFEPFFPRQRTLAEFLMCVASTTDGIMGVDSILDVFFSSAVSHHQLISFFYASEYDSRINKTITNNSSCDIENFRNFIDTFSRIIKFDDIIDIQISDFRGHVYDISSLSTMYIINGFLSSNCRCTTVPYFEKKLEGSQRLAKYKGKYYFVDGDMTFEEWKKTIKNI